MIVKFSKKKNVLVYGAGEAGRQLVNSLENNTEFKVVGFLDDNKKLYKKVLLDKIVYTSSDLKKLIVSKNVSLVFLATSLALRGFVEFPKHSMMLRAFFIEPLKYFCFSIN